MPTEQRFAGQVVAIIGCATGLGQGMAKQFAREGARLALADVDEHRLQELVDTLRGAGAEVVSQRVDVSDRADVDRFAALARETYGQVDMLCSNAGVAEKAAPAWKKSDADWQWVFGVNFFGLVNAVNAFLPAMIEADSGRLVATVSNSALVAPAAMASYVASKNACLGYCEVLAHDLGLAKSKVTVTAVCPGKMSSEMPANMQRRPAAFAGEVPSDDEVKLMQAFLADGGLSPEEAAAVVLDGIETGQFFVLTHPEDGAATLKWAEGVHRGQLVGLAEDTYRTGDTN